MIDLGWRGWVGRVGVKVVEVGGVESGELGSGG